MKSTELGEVTVHNLKQLKKLNQIVFPVSYNDKFYKDVLDVGPLAKLGIYLMCWTFLIDLDWRMLNTFFFSLSSFIKRILMTLLLVEFVAVLIYPSQSEDFTLWLWDVWAPIDVWELVSTKKTIFYSISIIF